jgi:hypothetical protein
VSSVLSAQTILYSDYESYDTRNNDMAIVGKVNGVLYTYRSSGSDYFLDAYDDNMHKYATVVLDFFPQKIYGVRFVPFQQSILVLYQEQLGTKIIQYAAMLDEKGLLQKAPVKIDEQRISFFGSSNKVLFTSAISENKQHLLIYSARPKNKRLHFAGYWLDVTTMKVIKRVKTNFDADQIVSVGTGLMSNLGQFYLPMYTLIGNKDFSDEYALLRLQINELNFKKCTLDIEDKYIAHPFQKMDQINGQIHFVSFYSSQKNGNNEGVLAASFDLDSARFVLPHFIPFEQTLKNETRAHRNNRALNDFKINQLIIKNDGGFVLAAEESFVVVRNNYMPGMGFYSFYYTPIVSQAIHEFHFNDILVMSYNASGMNEWHTFLRKEQYSQEDGGMFSSYAIMNTGGGLGFVFNDFNAHRSRLQIGSIASDGTLSLGIMDKSNNDDPDWLPKLGKQVDNREIVVPCLRKKQICFAKIVL